MLWCWLAIDLVGTCGCFTRGIFSRIISAPSCVLPFSASSRYRPSSESCDFPLCPIPLRGVPPVFVKRLGVTREENFGSLSSKAVSAVVRELERELGEFARRVTVASGGDLFICPKSTEQRIALLAKKRLSDGTEIGCKLPRSYGRSKVVIQGVPLEDDDQFVLEEVKRDCEEAVFARRILRGKEKIPTKTVVLEFATTEPPQGVHIGYRRSGACLTCPTL